MSDTIPWSTAQAGINAWLLDGSGLDQAHVFFAMYGAARPTAPYLEISLPSIRSVGHDWETRQTNTLVLPTQTVSAVVGSVLTIANHPFSNGDGPINIASTGSLPAPLLANTKYWVIVVDASHIQLATSYVNTGGQQPLGAGNPVTPITLTTTGSGVITIVTTPDSLPAGKEIIRQAQGEREVTFDLQVIGLEDSGIDAVRILSNVISALQLHVYDLDVAGLGIGEVTEVQALPGRRGEILEPRAVCTVTFLMASNLTAFNTIIETIEANIELEAPDTTALPAIPITITVAD